MKKKIKTIVVSCSIMAISFVLGGKAIKAETDRTYKWEGTVMTGSNITTWGYAKNNTSPVWVSYTTGSRDYNIHVSVEGRKPSQSTFTDYTYPDGLLSNYELSLNTSRYCSSYVYENCGAGSIVRLRILPQHGGTFSGEWRPNTSVGN